MISLAPSGPPVETATIYNLLAIISDPAATKKRLDELVSEKTAALEASDSAAKSAKEASQLTADAAAKLEEATRIRNEFDATHDVRKKQLDDHSDFLATKQNQLAAQEEEQSTRHAEIGRDLKAREEAVKAREGDITKREESLRATESAAQLLKETYERKVAALQAALDPGPVNYVMQADTGALGASMGEPK